MAHREDIRFYLESLEIDNCQIVDWGSGSKPVERYLKGENTYYRIDKRNKSDYPPDLVADILEPVILPKIFDHAFCMEVLEHVMYPYAVLENIEKNLKRGGYLHLSVPFMYPVHSEDDYLRYTEHALRKLFEETGFEVEHLVSTENNAGYIVRGRKL